MFNVKDYTYKTLLNRYQGFYIFNKQYVEDENKQQKYYVSWITWQCNG